MDAGSLQGTFQLPGSKPFQLLPLFESLPPFPSSSPLQVMTPESLVTVESASD